MAQQTNKSTDKAGQETDYRIMSDLEHILERPNLYIGGTNTLPVDLQLYKPSENRMMNYDDVGINDALLKFIDEIISNSVDEHRRSTSLFGVRKIKVRVEQNGEVCVEDDGGIRVKKHPTYKFYIPYMIFGILRSSGNYASKNPEIKEMREGVGQNGLGAKLANVFSEWFRVETADGVKSFDCTWRNNMKEYNEPIIHKTSEHYTRVSFKVDFRYFDCNAFSTGLIRLVQKRCMDAAAGNPGLEIEFASEVGNGQLNSVWKFNDFMDYAALYMTDYQRKNVIDSYSIANLRDRIILVPTDDKNSVNMNVLFVNGAMCNEGTHLDKIKSQVNSYIQAILKSKDIDMMTNKDLEKNYNIFAYTTIINPVYDSQIKDKLSSKLDTYTLALSKEFLKKIDTSEVLTSVLDYYKLRYEAQKKKELRKLNQTIKQTQSKKLINCTGKNAALNEMWLFEGNSAAAGFRMYRNPQTQAGYLLRGKIMNIIGLTKAEIVESVELREIIAALGLVFNNPEANLKNCRFGKIIICSDADEDGNHIAGLFLVFFCTLFPELVRAGRVYRAMSPIIVATNHRNHKQDLLYYTIDDYEKAEKKGLHKNLDIIYCKGLGGLSDANYASMLQQQKLIKFNYDPSIDNEMLKIWFDKSTQERKNLLLADGLATEE